MNNAAAQLVTNRVAVVEHEEIAVVSFLKKSTTWMKWEIETVATLGIIGLFAVSIIGALVQISPLSMYLQILS